MTTNRAITLFGITAIVPDAVEFDFIADLVYFQSNGSTPFCIRLDHDEPEAVAIAADVAECWYRRTHQAMKDSGEYYQMFKSLDDPPPPENVMKECREISDREGALRKNMDAWASIAAAARKASK